MRLIACFTSLLSIAFVMNLAAQADPTTAPANMLKSDVDAWQVASQEGGSVKAIKDMTDTAHPTLVLDVDKVDATDWHAQAYQTGMTVKKDTKYVLSFTGKADKPRQIAVFIQEQAAPYKMLSDGHAVSLTTDATPQTVELTAKDDSSDTKLTIVVGQATGKVMLSDITLTKAE